MEFAGALIDRTHQWCAESRFPIPVTLTYNRPNLPAGFAISSAEDMARTRLENSELLRVKDNAAFKRAITKLKDMPGKNIAVDSGEGTWRSFLKNDLWDGIDMLVHPLVIGSGKPVLASLLIKVPLRLVESKTYENGVVNLRYECVWEI